MQPPSHVFIAKARILSDLGLQPYLPVTYGCAITRVPLSLSRLAILVCSRFASSRLITGPTRTRYRVPRLPVTDSTKQVYLALRKRSRRRKALLRSVKLAIWTTQPWVFMT